MYCKENRKQHIKARTKMRNIKRKRFEFTRPTCLPAQNYPPLKQASQQKGRKRARLPTRHWHQPSSIRKRSEQNQNHPGHPPKSPILQPGPSTPNPSIKRLFDQQSATPPTKRKADKRAKRAKETRNINSPLSRWAQHTVNVREGKGSKTDSSKEQGDR